MNEHGDLDVRDCTRMESLLERQCEICGGLAELSQSQNRLIAGDEPLEDLMVVLGRKQVLIDELQRVESELKPLRQSWRQCQAEIPVVRREYIDDLVRRAGQILEGVLELEELGRARLMESRQRVAHDLTHLDKGRRIPSVYAWRPEMSEPRAIDRQS